MSTDTTTETEAAAALALRAADPTELAPGTVFAVLDSMGGLSVVDTDAYAPTPRRATAARVVTDAASFVGYVNRHKVPGTEVYAHIASSSVVAVIDSHEGTDADPGWQKHKLSLGLEHSKPWLAWAEHDLAVNKHGWMGQEQFAEFIEDRALDVVEPDHATLIDIATKFEAKKSADFQSSTRLDNGDVRFEFTETTTAKAGNKTDIEIPKRIRLALRPYIGGPIYAVWASFRYRVGNGGLLLGYALERPENILEAAFADIVTEIRDGNSSADAARAPHDGIGDVPIFYGRP